MIADELYLFKPETKRKLFILGAVGFLLFALGVFMAMSGGGHEAEGGHTSVELSKNLVATADHAAASEGHEVASAEHHGSPVWLKRIYTSLWHNNVFFAGAMLFARFRSFELLVGFGRISTGGVAWSVPLLGVRAGGN